MKGRESIVFFLLLLVFSSASPTQGAQKIRLVISMEVNQAVYRQTSFGEPPQIAIWLEKPGENRIRTIWVAKRSGRRWWKGKVECPTALPYWESRHRLESSEYRERRLLKRFIDAISGATPTGGRFSVETEVDFGQIWHYFVEVNLSGDFNPAFPAYLDDGTPDSEMNGQPSLVYKGVIKARPGAVAGAEVIGRSDQWVPVDTLIEDLTGMTTALEIITDLKAHCR